MSEPKDMKIVLRGNKQGRMTTTKDQVSTPDGADVPRVNWFKSSDQRDILQTWEDLPEDIVEDIMAKLPIPDLFRARAISTTMNDAVGDMLHGDSRFKRTGRRCEEADVQGLMIFHHDQFQGSYNIDQPLVFNPCNQGWHKLPDTR